MEGRKEACCPSAPFVCDEALLQVTDDLEDSTVDVAEDAEANSELP